MPYSCVLAGPFFFSSSGDGKRKAPSGHWGGVGAGPAAVVPSKYTQPGRYKLMQWRSKAAKDRRPACS